MPRRISAAARDRMRWRRVVRAVVAMGVPGPEEFRRSGRTRTADTGGGCEGRAPEGTRDLPVAEGHISSPECPSTPPVEATVVRAVVAPAPSGRMDGCDTKAFAKLDLSQVPSAMETRLNHRQQLDRAADFFGFVVDTDAASDGRLWCKCGGNPGGLVPAIFAIGCIEGDCPLRGAA